MKAIIKKNKNDIEKEMLDVLKQTHTNGLLQGSRAMCKVILDKANNKSKSSEERLEDIIKFCSISLGSSGQENVE